MTFLAGQKLTAADLNALRAHVEVDGKSSSAAPSTYTLDMSVALVTEANGWPVDGNGTAVTFIRSTSEAVQYVFPRNDSVNEPAYVRWTSGADTWGAFQRILTEDATGYDKIATQQTTTSTSYTDLTTVGPTVTFTCRAATRVAIHLKARFDNTATTGNVYMSFAASGATTQAASDSESIEQSGSGNQDAYGGLVTCDVSAGVTTFTAKYRVESGTGRFENRAMLVMPCA